MRFAVDTGGTFTDLVLEGDAGRRAYKAPTTPGDPLHGIIAALTIAAGDHDLTLEAMLGRGTMFVHATTHAINAVITGRTAKTALLTTEGHSDLLYLREGGRVNPFDFTQNFPAPYVPRSLTFGVRERVQADGAIRTPLDEVAFLDLLKTLQDRGVEAIAVCFLWSIINPAHELRAGELIARHMPGVPFTLSHQLNPVIREFRRASSAAVDASIKPLMSEYMGSLERRLSAAGYGGPILIVTSQGGLITAAAAAEQPLKVINSGPSMAPVAGRWFTAFDEGKDDAIIADTGGTTYDVSLVRRGAIPTSRDTWVGPRHQGIMIGFPWVDVRSVGAGGGSIAWLDKGGLLRVGPQSAGAVPGPVAYGKGGSSPTVTDAALALGYLDPGFFLGGAMRLDRAAAVDAIRFQIAEPLHLSVEEAAEAIISIATESMAQAIVDITVKQGVDPAGCVLVGGGGAAGLNSVRIARRLGCDTVLIPELGAVLSAAGALMSDLRADYEQAFFTRSDAFDRTGTAAVLHALRQRCEAFVISTGRDASAGAVRFSAQARYTSQVWEIETPISGGRFDRPEDLEEFVRAFHAVHEDLFSFSDQTAAVEILGLTATVTCTMDSPEQSLAAESVATAAPRSRRVHFPDTGWRDTPVTKVSEMPIDARLDGPCIIESEFTTIVVDPGASAVRRPSGSISIHISTEN